MEALLRIPWIAQDPDVFTFQVVCADGAVLVDRDTLLLHSDFFRARPPDGQEVVIGKLVCVESLRRALGTWYGLPLRIADADQLVEVLDAADFLEDRAMTAAAMKVFESQPVGRMRTVWSLVTERHGILWVRPCLTWIAGRMFEMLYRCWSQPALKPGAFDFYGDWQALVDLPFCDCIRRWTGETSLDAFGVVTEAEPALIPHLLQFQTPATPHMRHLSKLYAC